MFCKEKKYNGISTELKAKNIESGFEPKSNPLYNFLTTHKCCHLSIPKKAEIFYILFRHISASFINSLRRGCKKKKKKNSPYHNHQLNWWFVQAL